MITKVNIFTRKIFLLVDFSNLSIRIGRVPYKKSQRNRFFKVFFDSDRLIIAQLMTEVFGLFGFQTSLLVLLRNWNVSSLKYKIGKHKQFKMN